MTNNPPPTPPRWGARKLVTMPELAYFGPGGGKSTLEKQKTASEHHVMKIRKIANSVETLFFSTRRGEIDPGEAENCLKMDRQENYQKSKIWARLAEFGRVRTRKDKTTT